MSVTFAVTAYEELSKRRSNGALIRRCLRSAQDHPGIDEIVVVDDASLDVDGLRTILKDFPKASIFRNETRLRVFGNKIEAVLRSRGDWVITCDSDNMMDRAFIDMAIEATAGPSSACFCPTFARPHFDYRDMRGSWDRHGIRVIAKHPRFGCFINTGNQTVHREAFAKVFGEYRGKPLSSFMPALLGTGQGYPDAAWDGNDSRIFNWLWLRAGNILVAESGMEYEHAVSDQPGNYVECARDQRCSQIGRVIDRMFSEGL